MKPKRRQKNKANKARAESIQVLIALGVLYSALVVLAMLPSPMRSVAVQFYDNTTVITRLNISNAAPIVSNVFIYDNDSINSTSGDIKLTPGTTDIITCNATINDSNGWNDVVKVNATLFQTGRFNDPVDKNYKYQNSSCAIVLKGLYAAGATCTFAVEYFANNGTWNCSVTAVDNGSIQAQAFADNLTTIARLYAISLQSNVIDYGVLNVTQISPVQPFNVTNAGNMHINLSVEGYAETPGDGYAMKCQGNTFINVSLERYALFQGANWSVNMTLLTSSPLPNGIANLTIFQNTDDNGVSRNTTYWAIKAPIGVQSGACNGTILFSAIPA